MAGLHKRRGGTSYYDASAVEVGPNIWRVCYWTRSLDETDTWVERCYRQGTGPTTWVPSPCCDDEEYPSRLWGKFSHWAGDECGCLYEGWELLEWDETVGLHGGWVGAWQGCGTSATEVRILHDFCNPGGVRWILEMEYQGIIVGTVLTNATCGLLPSGQQMTLIRPHPCNGATVQLDLEPAWW